MSSNLPEFITNPNPELYLTGNYVVLDFETTNKEKGSPLNKNNRIVLACWKEVNGSVDYWYKWGNEYEQQELLECIERSDFIVCHNAKFELQWLKRCGYDLGSKVVYDTMVGEWVLAGNRTWGRLAGLDDCLKRRGMRGKQSIVSSMIKSGTCPSDIPRSLLLEYCIDDVEGTEELMQNQLKALQKDKLLPVMYTRMITTPVLADIEFNGIHLDKVRVEQEYEQTLSKYIEVQKRMELVTGGINPRSVNQVADFIYTELGFKELKSRSTHEYIRNKPSKHFPDGAPKTDKDTLMALTVITERQREFIELKKNQGKLNAALTKNLEMFTGACREDNGMFFGIFNQCITKTHRLSSSGRPTKYDLFDKSKSTQFQNLPRAYKKLFNARKKGWLMVEADGKTLEFSTAGHLGKDPIISQEIKDHYDVHKYTASVINNILESEVTGALRRDAKEHTFKPLYAGTSGTKDERRYYEAFQKKYKVLHKRQKSWVREVLNTGKLVTEWGMSYYWPDTKMTSTGYITNTTNIFNYPIQALATAEIIPIALVCLWYRTRDMDMFIVNTVHDSVIAEVPEYELGEYELNIAKAFTKDVYKYLDLCYNMSFTVPLGVDIKIGSHWGEVGIYSDPQLVDLSKDLMNEYNVGIVKGEISFQVDTPTIIN